MFAVYLLPYFFLHYFFVVITHYFLLLTTYILPSQLGRDYTCGEFSVNGTDM